MHSYKYIWNVWEILKSLSFHLQVEDLGLAAAGFGDQLFEQNLQHLSTLVAQLSLHLVKTTQQTRQTT